jgi:hypothetical protein
MFDDIMHLKKILIHWLIFFDRGCWNMQNLHIEIYNSRIITIIQ